MKKEKLILFLSVLCMYLINCSDWPTSYERIDDNKVRTLDFVYQNSGDTTLCEAMPGDTLLLYAYFGGEPITDIDWKVSYNIFRDPYGEMDTALDVMPLEYTPITPDMTDIPQATQAIGLQFIIPENVMVNNKSLNNEFVNEIASQTGLAKEQLFTALNLLARTDTTMWSNFIPDPQQLAELKQQLPHIVQQLAIEARIIVKINGLYNVESDFTIRFNRGMHYFPGIYTNANPKISYIGLYKLKDSSYPYFNPQDMSVNDSVLCLYIADSSDMSSVGKNFITGDTVLIDKGFTYYLCVDTGYINNRDYRDLAISMTGNVDYETIFTQWCFRQEPDEITDIAVSEFMQLEDDNEHMVEFLPPLTDKIKTITFWVQNFDYFLGERFRPSASSLKGGKFYFKYTQAYLDNIDD